MIYVNRKDKKVVRVKNRDYGDMLFLVDGVLCQRWLDGDFTIVKNINVIKGIFNFKHEHEAWNKYYLMLRDLEIISPSEYIVLVDAIEKA